MKYFFTFLGAIIFLVLGLRVLQPQFIDTYIKDYVNSPKIERNHSDQDTRHNSGLNKNEAFQHSYSDESRQRDSVRDDLHHPIFTEISNMLQDANYQEAVVALEKSYSLLSREQIDVAKTLLLHEADDLASQQDYYAAVELLSNYTQSFDELTAWQKLGRNATKNQDWRLALNSQIRALQLETTNQGFATSLEQLNLAARYVRANYERANDFPAIVSLYESLNAQFPEQAKFQLDLAQAYLQMENFWPAKQLLTGLQFDPDFSEIALQLLAKIPTTSDVATAKNARQSLLVDEVSVPLQRLGSSLVAPVTVSGVELELLLDTGASITALTPITIDQLGLQPTGQTITLSTANGIRQASLYRADEVRLGRLVYSNVIVAEVDLDAEGRVQGLLGTDLLSRSNDQYRYLIDDLQNALIFRTR